MKVVFLAGAGGVGKTVVVEKIKQMEPEVVVMPSISRSVYAKMGIATEKVAMGMSDEERLTFQSLILDTYIEEVYKKIKETHETNPDACMVIDRSPFDHVAYQTYILPNMPLAQIYRNEDKAFAFYQRVSFLTKELTTVLFPFPVPWETEGGSFDEVRHAPDAKNLAWHALIDFFLYRHHVVTKMKRLNSVTIKGRAYEVLQYLVV